MRDKLRRDLLEVCVKAQDMSLCKAGSGNFSLKDKKTGLILISPSGVDRKDLSEDDFFVMDPLGKIISSKEGLRPTSEAMMHLAIYKYRKDIFGICHTHSKFATSFAVLNRKIPAFLFEISALKLKKAYVPVAKFGLPGSTDLARNIKDAIEIADAVLLERHGAVTCGKDIFDALKKAEYLEEVAEIYKNVLDINKGQEPKSFLQEELDSWTYPENFDISNI